MPKKSSVAKKSSLQNGKVLNIVEKFKCKFPMAGILVWASELCHPVWCPDFGVYILVILSQKSLLQPFYCGWTAGRYMALLLSPNICGESPSCMHTCIHKHLHTCKHGFWTWTKWLTWCPDVTDCHECCVSEVSHLPSLLWFTLGSFGAVFQ